MEDAECKGCPYCRVLGGELTCTFGGYCCPISMINYCQKNEREDD